MAAKTVENICICLSFIFFFLIFPISIFFSFMVVAEFQRAIVFRLGRLRSQEASGPGYVFILVCVDTFILADLRIFTIDINPQEILSKDQITVQVNAMVFYYIADPLLAVTKVNNFKYSTILLGATILRNVLGTKDLIQILCDRTAIADAIQNQLDKATDPWGIKVLRVEIKDVRLPYQMQRAMATEAEASREAKAKVASAEGELKASQMLKEASDILSTSGVALQLRYLQTLTTITAQRKSKILFPIPMDIMPQK